MGEEKERTPALDPQGLFRTEMKVVWSDRGAKGDIYEGPREGQENSEDKLRQSHSYILIKIFPKRKVPNTENTKMFAKSLWQ